MSIDITAYGHEEQTECQCSQCDLIHTQTTRPVIADEFLTSNLAVMSREVLQAVGAAAPDDQCMGFSGFKDFEMNAIVFLAQNALTYIEEHREALRQYELPAVTPSGRQIPAVARSLGTVEDLERVLRMLATACANPEAAKIEVT